MKPLLPKLLFVFLLVILGGWTLSAEADRQTARRAYRKAYSLFHEGKYKLALFLFQKTERELPQKAQFQKARTELLYYRGICYYHLGNLAQARDQFQRYLKAPARFQREQKKVKVKKMLAVVQEKLKPKEPDKPSFEEQAYPLFRQGKYRSALLLLKKAEKKLPSEARFEEKRTKLLYYQGICYYHLGEWAQAGDHFQRYLKAPARFQKEQRKARARKLLAVVREKLKSKEPVRIPPPSVPPARRGGPHVGAFVVLGVGLAALGAGVITGVLAQTRMVEAEETFVRLKERAEPPASEVSAPAREAQGQALVANVFFVAGGVVTAVGGVLLFVWRQPAAASPAPSSASPSGGNHLFSLP